MRRHLSVLEGRTYTDLHQILSRSLGSAYLLAFRWLGNPDDAEGVAFGALALALEDLRWPAPVGVVNDQVQRALFAELDLHWFDRYRLGATAPAIAACEARRGGIARSLDDLLEGLCTRERLMLVLLFIRRRPLGSIAAQLHEGRDEAVSGLIGALAKVAGGLDLEVDVPPDADRVIAYVDALTRRRRPPRFSAGRSDWALMAAAAHLQSTIARNNLIRPAFRRAVYESLVFKSEGARNNTA